MLKDLAILSQWDKKRSHREGRRTQVGTKDERGKKGKQRKVKNEGRGKEEKTKVNNG